MTNTNQGQLLQKLKAFKENPPLNIFEISVEVNRWFLLPLQYICLLYTSQQMDEFGGGVTLVTGSEEVAKEDVMQEVGKQNGIEEVGFLSDGESALEMAGEFLRVKLNAKNTRGINAIPKLGMNRVKEG